MTIAVRAGSSVVATRPHQDTLAVGRPAAGNPSASTALAFGAFLPDVRGESA